MLPLWPLMFAGRAGDFSCGFVFEGVARKIGWRVTQIQLATLYQGSRSVKTPLKVFGKNRKWGVAITQFGSIRSAIRTGDSFHGRIEPQYNGSGTNIMRPYKTRICFRTNSLSDHFLALTLT
jgi:hypothetical protein